MAHVSQSHDRLKEHPFPDVILKSQFFDVLGRRALSSEQRLMLAVLADAINVVQKGCESPSARRQKPFAEARSWIFVSRARCALAFENVCDALGLDVAALRWRVSRLLSGSLSVPLRLRLKEASRVQRVTVNRVRRRANRRHRLKVPRL